MHLVLFSLRRKATSIITADESESDALDEELEEMIRNEKSFYIFVVWLCRKAIREDLEERRTEVLTEAAKAEKSIRYAKREFANRKKKTAFRTPKGTTFASRREMEKIIYNF
ncbi:hypothetical protein RB195_004501 [Necator americanus]|uniref:Uncharacterized protein n=1 Tax=Necator americanus TaxID=51031 RepID=A0ABR1BLL7_NECAM